MAGLERPSTSAQAGADEGGSPRTSPGMTSRVDEPARDARPVMAGFERAIHVCPGDAEEGWTGGTGPAATTRVGTDFVPPLGVSIDLTLVRDHPAVIRQGPGRHEVDGPLELRDRLKSRNHRGAQLLARGPRFGSESHYIRLALAGHDEAEPAQVRVALRDFRHLLGAHEHALDLCGLVGAAH